MRFLIFDLLEGDGDELVVISYLNICADRGFTQILVGICCAVQGCSE